MIIELLVYCQWTLISRPQNSKWDIWTEKVVEIMDQTPKQ